MLELNEKLTVSSKKVTELENVNTRLKLMSDQSSEALAQNNKNSKPNIERKEHRNTSKNNSSQGRSRQSPARSSPSQTASKPPRRSSSHKSPEKSQIRCKANNTGKCYKGRECRDIHVERTCQLFSKLSFCPHETTCEFRHPTGTCYEWENTERCSHGDSCRYKHPLQWMPSQWEAFLCNGTPGYPNHSMDPQQPQRQGNRHHDLRGNRW